jgi:hypothetical protein
MSLFYLKFVDLFDMYIIIVCQIWDIWGHHYYCFIIIIIIKVLGIEPKGSHMLGKHTTTELHLQLWAIVSSKIPSVPLSLFLLRFPLRSVVAQDESVLQGSEALFIFSSFFSFNSSD